MVVLEAIGLAAGEIFDYNRENYKWDQELRFKKDESRVKMQIERFDLFREDIEDLVKLTVGKMDMYHGVGEIFLAFSLTLYTEGRIANSAPVFLTTMYFFSVACAWIYILLAVWLAVYASITAQSFGVRLRTRYLRLPIPSLAHINRLTARLADFEKQNAQDILRVPFSTGGAPKWEWQFDPAKQAAGGDQGGAASSSSSWNAKRQPPGGAQGAEADLLGAGESAFGKMDVIHAAAGLPGRHVQLYRQLQSKWQCYDAYSRVSMAMGVNNLLQAVNFFVIGITLVENRAKSCGYALTFVFQAARLALGYLDIAGMHNKTVTMVQLMGTVPVVIVLIALSVEDHTTMTGRTASAASFFCMVIWFQLLIWVAQPSGEAALPLKYRTVLFLDVFGDSSYDPTEAEHGPMAEGQGISDEASAAYGTQRSCAATAEAALATAQAALRRWEAVPDESLLQDQQPQLLRLRKEYTIWRKAYQGHLVQQANQRGVPMNSTLRDTHELRSWEELAAQEQHEDEFADSWLGPMQRGPGMSKYYYSLELAQVINEQPSWQQRVLTLQEVAKHVRAAKAAVQDVLMSLGAESAEAGRPRSSSADLGGRSGSNVGPAPAPKVVRLPWRVVERMSRLMQILWLFLGLMEALEVRGGVDNDKNIGSRGPGECFPWENCHRREGEKHTGEEEGGEEGAQEHGEETHEGGEPGHAGSPPEHPSAAAGEAHTEGGAAHEGGEPGPAGSPAEQPSAAAGEAHTEGGAVEHRRLQGLRGKQPRPPARPRQRARRPALTARLAVAWPHGLFFRPRALGRLPATPGALPGVEGLLVASPYALYRARGEEPAPLKLEAFPFADVPPESVALCAAAEVAGAQGPDAGRCLLGAPAAAGVTLWPWQGSRGPREGRSALLPVRGRPWQLLAGASVRCAEVAGLLAEATPATWCLLLAGWDGLRLPVAAVPLPAGPGELPALAASVASRFDAPLLPPAKAQGCAAGAGGAAGPTAFRAAAGEAVVALHMEPETGRLWALLAGGELQAWELRGTARSLARWRPQWPGWAGAFDATAVCGSSSRGVLVAGVTGQGSPELFRTSFPPELRSLGASEHAGSDEGNASVGSPDMENSTHFGVILGA